MSERSSWWKSVTMRHKGSVSAKDAAEQGLVSGQGPRLSADRGKPTKDVQAEPKQASEEEAREARGEEVGQEEQPTFSEKSSRRNLKVSRSGRFKEKRRARAAIPVSYEEKSPSGKGDVR